MIRPETHRQLAAIVFTDIVGYSKLSQHNEALAVRLLEAHDSLVRAVLNRHGGREVKTIGDSFLLEFPSALEAVGFAIDLQGELGKPNGSAMSGESFSVRIGVHVGDVIHRDGDVIGDTVNIASRIVRAADDGGVCISGQVHDQVRNKLHYALEKLPQQSLKNIDYEVDLYRVVLFGEQGAGPSLAAAANRIAILPFSNISPDPTDGYFADGLTEELISVLSEVRGLRVIARTSVNYYKETARSAKQIGAELKVSHLLEGSVRKVANRIKITVRLVDVESQEEIWSETYEKDLVDVFSIQSEIAARVVESLRIKLLSDEKRRLKTKETENAAAYVAYLKGRSILRDDTEEAVHLAKAQFELAIKEDSYYAKAYAGMADTVILLGDYLFSPVPVALEEATRWVEKALALDPDLAEARVSLANVLMWNHKFEEARKEFLRAIEANPSYATGHHWYSMCLQTFGRRDEALQEVLHAEELDPLSSGITLSAIYRLIGYGADEEIKKRIRKLEGIDPKNPRVEEAKMAYAFAKKDWDTATTHLSKMIEQDPKDPYLDTDVAYIYAVTGRQRDALKLVEKLKQVPDDAGIKGQLLAFVYVGLGDLDSAFEWLNFALAKREFFISWVRGYPLFEPVRRDSRFNDLLRAANLPA